MDINQNDTPLTPLERAKAEGCAIAFGMMEAYLAREEEWRKFTGTTPDDAPDLVGALRRIADEKPCLDFRRCEDYGCQAAEVARAALSSLSDQSDQSEGR